MEIAFLVLASILTLIGLAGCVLPVLPGTPLNYLALLILHFTRGGDVFSVTVLVVLGVLTALSMALDYVLPLIGARLYGASKYGMAFSAVGMVFGLLLFSFPGMVIGTFLGAITGELVAGKRGSRAFKSGLATYIGGLSAMALKFGLSFFMSVYFVVKLVSG